MVSKQYLQMGICLMLGMVIGHLPWFFSEEFVFKRIDPHPHARPPIPSIPNIHPSSNRNKIDSSTSLSSSTDFPTLSPSLDFVNRNVIYMFVLARTDLEFYQSLKLSNHLVLVFDQSTKHLSTSNQDIILSETYEYKTLDAKVFATLSALQQRYPTALSFSKLDDDAMITYHHWVSTLEQHFEQIQHVYLGGMKTRTIDGLLGEFLYAEGPFYTLGRKLVDCVVDHAQVFRDNARRAEDVAVGFVVANHCKREGVVYLDVTEAKMVWHRGYQGGKNKVCNLEQQVVE